MNIFIIFLIENCSMLKCVCGVCTQTMNMGDL